MKNITTKILLLILFSNYLQYGFADSTTEDVILKKYIVTAYYSPLPNQKFYLRWNYEDEIILNWEGKWWASGKAVYSWMIAAPKTYKFWTKIYLDWIWIWTVDDRWWAIVGSWSRGYDWDRLDIWMGYWDDWLKRALTWWKRTVYWRVLSSEEQNLSFISVDNFKIWKIDFQSLKNAQLVWKNSTKISQVVSKYVVPNQILESTNSDTIKYFQTILHNLWYYNWDIDGKYSSKINKAVLDFQLDNKIVISSKDKWAWYYGPKTKETLNTKYLWFLNQEKIRIAKEKQIKDEIAYIDSQVEKVIKSLWTPKENEVWNHVRKLQKTLKLLWYFEWKDTAIYWKITKESILKYQIKNWLVTNAWDKWAGLIWEKTLSKLQADIRNIAMIDENILKEILS